MHSLIRAFSVHWYSQYQMILIDGSDGHDKTEWMCRLCTSLLLNVAWTLDWSHCDNSKSMWSIIRAIFQGTKAPWKQTARVLITIITLSFQTDRYSAISDLFAWPSSMLYSIYPTYMYSDILQSCPVLKFIPPFYYLLMCTCLKFLHLQCSLRSSCWNRVNPVYLFFYTSDHSNR